MNGPALELLCVLDFEIVKQVELISLHRCVCIVLLTKPLKYEWKESLILIVNLTTITTFLFTRA